MVPETKWLAAHVIGMDNNSLLIVDPSFVLQLLFLFHLFMSLKQPKVQTCLLNTTCGQTKLERVP